MDEGRGRLLGTHPGDLQGLIRGLLADDGRRTRLDGQFGHERDVRAQQPRQHALEADDDRVEVERPLLEHLGINSLDELPHISPLLDGAEDVGSVDGFDERTRR